MRKALLPSLIGLSMAGAGVVATTTAAFGQQATAPSAANPLGLPDTVTLLGQADPNVRKATAVVNGQVITGTDVAQRVALLTNASGGELPEAELQRVRMQVLRNLIDETLQIQEAKAQEIEVPQAEVNNTYARVASQNFGQDLEAMDDYLISIGSSPVSLKRQIEGELAWQRLLRRNVQPFVNVAEEEVTEVIKRLEESRGTEEYRVGEIFLESTPQSAAQVEQNGRQIVEQLQQGASFVAYARQFSQATTAAVGGDLGWIRLPQLRSPQLESIVSEMQPGQLVGPVQIPGGYWIVYLIDKRQVLTADPRDAVLSLKQISIGFEPGTSEQEVTARVEAFQQGVAAIAGCGAADAAAAQLGATVVTNDQIRVRSLPEQLQSSIINLQVGQSTPPFGSVEDGVRVLLLCGRDDPESSEGPNFDQMMAQIEDERVNKRAQRYLRDLRNDAYIEYN
ncbi:peptidylprolyl isomerase [Erythrobacter sp. W53]|uniref:peptidylprolyl isomerase n=1 Tax=Erythrobacter sp. W53 TaxID=3425947 RepID=UPI003D769256